MGTKETRARVTDPVTSFIAAADAGRRSDTVRARVLWLLTQDGVPLTHDGLISRYRRECLNYGWAPATDSSIRTRCAELVDDGLVEAVPDTAALSRYGRPSLLWRAVGVQSSETVGPSGKTGAGA